MSRGPADTIADREGAPGGAPRATVLRWRTLVTPPTTGAENMALDDALLERARATGEATLRIYAWSSPTLSLGRNQPAAGLYDVSRAAELGVSFVRRQTGGRAVLHHREATYSVTAPTAPMGALRESYSRINRLLIDALARLGVRASEAEPAGRSPLPGIAPCFETPVAGEIVVGGRKLVGSAQWRDRDALLQHGSILLANDQWMASALLLDPVAPPPPPATLSALVSPVPTLADVASAFGAALRGREDVDAAPLILDQMTMHHMDEARHHFENDAWTWRL
ncbi:MAG: lipoate--protein ligase family protein [Gemmatimonadota bacterium]|nr:lipoate--protein ligase family protein [Gemmatimonadota bacterium]